MFNNEETLLNRIKEKAIERGFQYSGVNKEGLFITISKCLFKDSKYQDDIIIDNKIDEKLDYYEGLLSEASTN